MGARGVGRSGRLRNMLSMWATLSQLPDMASSHAASGGEGTKPPDAVSEAGATPAPSTGQHPRAFSPTALRTYDECRLRYRYAYLDKPEVEEEPSAHLVFGNALHKAMAFLYRLPVEKRCESAAHRALRHFWARMPDRHLAFADDEDRAAWGRSALDALSRYCQGHVLDSRPVAIEEWVHGDLG